MSNISKIVIATRVVNVIYIVIDRIATHTIVHASYISCNNALRRGRGFLAIHN